MVVRRMPYEQFVEYLEEKCENYFQDMDLLEYLSQAITNEMDTCVFKKICPPKKRYFNDFFMDEMVDWIKIEAVEARTSTTDKGKEKVSEDATEVVEARRSIVDRGFNSDYESEFDSDDDSDYHSDKSVDCLSLGQEDLIELRNRMKVNREAKAKAKEVISGSEGFTIDEGIGHAITGCGSYQEYLVFMPLCMYSTILPPKPRKMHGRPRNKRIRSIGEGGSSTRVFKVGRPRKNQSNVNLEDADVVFRGTLRDEGVGGSRRGVGGSIGGAGVSRGGVGGSRVWKLEGELNSLQEGGEDEGFDSNEEEVVPKINDVSLVDGVFDVGLGGVRKEDFVMGEGVRKRGLCGCHGSRREVKKMIVKMMKMVETRENMISISTKTKDIFSNYVDPYLYNVDDFTSQDLIILNHNLLVMTNVSDDLLSFDLNIEFDVIGRRRIGLIRTTC
uniref:Uncharacterized protein n=1 Tax=Tanacetum cinerariifolium TaxID=118510 RepID=A0A699GYY7_TANCI|nr:hypothetical protein [Tanacetum cinerariifolium]